jgi:hypothetical protein
MQMLDRTTSLTGFGIETPTRLPGRNAGASEHPSQTQTQRLRNAGFPGDSDVQAEPA